MSSFVLKVIALSAMVVDHAGFVFAEQLPGWSWGGISLYFWCRIIGRLAFPIFVYLVAEGCRQTRSMPHYLLRLGIFAVISEVPFDMAFNSQINFVSDTNIFYTLFLGALAVYILQLLANSKVQRWVEIAASLACLSWLVVLAELLVTDYAGYGVAFVFIMYAISSKPLRLAAMVPCCIYQFWQVAAGLAYNTIGITALSNYQWNASRVYVTMLAFCVLTVPLVAFYNGKRGLGFKWLFYVVYPAHLLAFAGIAVLLS